MRALRVIGEGRSFYHCVSRVVDRRFVFGGDEMRVFRNILRLLERFTGVRVVTYCLMSNHFHLLLDVPERSELEPLTLEELLGFLPELHDPTVAEGVRQEIERALASEGAGEREAGGAGAGLREFGAETTGGGGGGLGIGLVRHEPHEGAGGRPQATGVAGILARYERRRGDLSMFMKMLKLRLTIYMNERLDRVGTLWESRFKSVLVEGDEAALMAVAAYIDLNPVRAGIVGRPEDYPYSGYGEAVSKVSKGRGAALAKRGLGRILREALGRRSQDAAAGGEAWSRTLARYRLFLYESGVALAEDAAVGSPGRKGISRAEVEAVRAESLEAGRREEREDAEDDAGPQRADYSASVGAPPPGECPGFDAEPGELEAFAASVAGRLRGRVRYFSDGGILGSAEFVDSSFEREKALGRAGAPRRSGARRLRGGGWGPLRVFRDLQKDPLGPGDDRFPRK